MSDERYDVIIVGSGPGGASVVWSLAKTGKRILVVERGGYLPRERGNWDTDEVFRKARLESTIFGTRTSCFASPGWTHFSRGSAVTAFALSRPARLR